MQLWLGRTRPNKPKLRNRNIWNMDLLLKPRSGVWKQTESSLAV